MMVVATVLVIAIVVVHTVVARRRPARIDELASHSPVTPAESSRPAPSHASRRRDDRLTRAVRARARRRARDREVSSDLAETIDLLALAVGAGQSVHQALRSVCDGSRSLLTDTLAGALAAADAGDRLADALASIDLGDEVRGLVDALVDAERYGAPLVAALDRASAEARHRRRVRGEQAARVLSVKLLFPLVCCVLPAFVLVTVVPFVARSFTSLAP